MLAKAVRRARAGLKDPRRPIGSFIFLGPTGVGKTLLARRSPSSCSAREDHLIKIDMSEFMERHSVARLVGAPPGYIGYEEGGQLTEAVRRKSYSVILLDEIEKAHPEAFNMLLQIMEDGNLADAKGRKVDFRRCSARALRYRRKSAARGAQSPVGGGACGANRTSAVSWWRTSTTRMSRRSSSRAAH